MKQTQIEWAKTKLRENGEVGRNEALREYITRLGSIVNRLNKEGWSIKGGYRNGDYIYFLLYEPKKTFQSFMCF